MTCDLAEATERVRIQPTTVRKYPVVLRSELKEVEAPAGWERIAAQEAREAATRLADRIARWPQFDPTERAWHLKHAIFEIVTITLHDSEAGAGWLASFARLRAIPTKQLRDTIQERCDLHRHLAVLYVQDKRAVEEAVCRLIVN